MSLLLKRQMDIWGALAGLIVLTPMFLLVAVIIKFTSPGPVFFRHERIGKDGKGFKPFKFRTMSVGAIDKGLKYTVAEQDERITGIGHILRKWGVDELPQLINVINGDMSLVGPRPTFRYQVEKYNEFQKKRLSVKPGVVGLALIKGRNRLSWEERIRYDVEYIENWSLLLDIKIIFLSFYAILIIREGVYGEGGVNDLFE